MAWIKKKRAWELSESRVTPEAVYRSRRRFLKQMAHVGVAAALLTSFPAVPGISRLWAATEPNSTGDAANEALLTPTPQSIVSRFNNFYEFGAAKDRIWRLAENMDTDSWSIEVRGLVKKPRTLDVEKIISQMPAEERIYRLRCVEAWSVIVPWTGFPLKKLIELCEPLGSARYVQFSTFLNPNTAPGQKDRFWEPWPYTEGLTLKEAAHDLSFLATGIYGGPLPNQNGAPIRLVVPWKYGFKSIKSIARIEFTREEPETFWQSMSPLEYDFPANVDPSRPYARWHQEFERIPGEEKLFLTEPYNGFKEQVASLYPEKRS